MLLRKGPQQIQGGTAAGINVELSLNAIEGAFHLRDVRVELKGHHCALALVGESGRRRQRDQVMLIIHFGDKALEDFIANQPVDRDALHVSEGFHRKDGKDLIGEGRVAHTQTAHLDQPNILRLFAYTPALEGPLGFQTELPGQRRGDDIGPSGVTQHPKRALIVELHLDIDVIVEQLERHGRRALASGNGKIRRRGLWHTELRFLQGDVELDFLQRDILVVLWLAVGGAHGKRHFHSIHGAVIGKVGSAGFDVGLLHGVIDHVGSGIDPQVEWAASLRCDPQNIERPALLFLPAETLDLRRPALWKPVPQSIAVSFISRFLPRIFCSLRARFAGGILRPDQLPVEAVGAGCRTELVFFNIPPGKVVLP